MGRYLDRKLREFKMDKPPNLIKQAFSYVKEYAKWKKAGSVLRSAEEITRIFNTICKLCEHFEGNRCGICKCYLNTGTTWNKIAFNTTKCPDNPPRWTAEVEIEDVELNDEEVDKLSQELKIEETLNAPESTPSPPPAPPPRKPCGCS